jgi:hypothetical protein
MKDNPGVKKPAKGAKPDHGTRKDLKRKAQATRDQQPTPKSQRDRSHPEVPPRKRARTTPIKHEPHQSKEQRSLEPVPAPAPVSQAEAFEELVRRANQGNEACLQGLREILEQRADIWRQVGDVAALAERAWVELLSAGNKLLEESILRCLKELKADLAGPSPTPLERLLINYLGTTWLASQQGELAAAQMGGSPELNRLRLRRAESAQKRFTGAVKTLSLVRALVPCDQREQERED